MKTTPDFIHHLQPGSSETSPVLMLFHGTGGTERDLLSLADLFGPDSPVISPRGQVLENGQPRFFRRLREGVFDVEDLEKRVAELGSFLDHTLRRHHWETRPKTVIGFSNGANAAAALLWRFPRLVDRAVLFRPMLPYDPGAIPDLSHARVLIASGQDDPLATPEQVEDLVDLLRGAGAEVTHRNHGRGHGLSRGEIEGATAWHAGLSE